MTPYKILLMEDEPHLRRLYRKSLHWAGYEVHVAASVQEAREALQRHTFDVFLCDMYMGSEYAMALIREQYALLALRQTEVVMLSQQAHNRALCEDIGVRFFLAEVVTAPALVKLVNSLVGATGLPAAV
jgi:CheY-like chemotaxis protein